MCLEKKVSKVTLRVLHTSVSRGEYAPTAMTKTFVPPYAKEGLQSPFDIKPDDDIAGMSQEDISFMDIISNGITVNEKGNLEMPLPLKLNAEIPDNKWSVFGRTKNCLERLKRSGEELDTSLAVMGEYLQAGHVEQIVGTGEASGRTCYIPIFPVNIG